MDIPNMFFNCFFALFFLLAIGVVIFSSFIIFNPPRTETLEKNANRFLGIVFTVVGLELCLKIARMLFDVNLPDTHFLVGASAIFLFLIILGISTIVGQSFLAENLIPQTKSQKLFLGSLFAFLGVSLFFLIQVLNPILGQTPFKSMP